MSWTSPYLPYLQSNASSIPTTDTEGTYCAIAPLCGCIIGALIGANIADKFGRKKSVLLLAPVTFFSFIGMAFVKHIWFLSIFRLIIGITDGCIFTIVPLYIGEVVDPEVRGFAASLLSILFSAGSLLINTIGPFMSIYYSSLVISIFTAVHFFIFIFMPESPYYFVSVNKYKDAENSLKKLKGYNNIQKNVDYLKEAIASENKLIDKIQFTNLFTVSSNRKACIIFLIILWASRMSGKLPILLFTTNIFIESGSTIDASLSVIIYCLVELSVCTIGGLITDKIGKRPLMITSGIGCTLMIFLLGLYFYFKESGYAFLDQLYWLPITSLILHTISYSIGFGYLCLGYISELFPMNVKPKAACMAEIGTVIFGIITSQFFQLTKAYFGMSVPFLSFAMCCCIGVILICKTLPETRGKSLEEIQDYLITSSKNK